MEEFAQNFNQIFGLLSQFRSTPQDSEWHGEGDVFIHTQRVLENIYKIIDSEARHLPDDQKLALILAAVLHDIGKPLTTKEKEINGTKKIVAPNHEERGCSYIAYRILELDIPYDVAHRVLDLVRYHHLPKLFVIKNRGKTDYFQLGRCVNVELLYYIAKADMLGRQCPNQQDQLNLIDLFRMFCEEHGMWQKESPYHDWLEFFKRELSKYPSDCQEYIYGNAIRDFEEGLIFTPHEAIARHYSHLDSFPHLIILSGPSGSGKSSWIQEHLKGYEIISLDRLREELGKNRYDQSINDKVLQKAKQELKVHLAHRKKVVWDATNLRKDFRSILNGFGIAYHAFITLIVFHQRISDVLSGNKNREESIASEIVEKQMNTMEWVELKEAHKTMFVYRKMTLKIR